MIFREDLIILSWEAGIMGESSWENEKDTPRIRILLGEVQLV
jgi:hypothetical protein